MTSYNPYLEMQKKYYEDESVSPEDIVGFYDYHEVVPYETLLLYKNADVRYPLLNNLSSKVALDFGCGPGRMVARMDKLFARADGVDIAQRLLDEAKQKTPSSNFYLTRGDDLGGAPENHYDFVYSTLCMQHIAVHSARMNIWRHMARAMKPGAAITLQFAFNPDFPFVHLKQRMVRLNQLLPSSRGSFRAYFYREDTRHAHWGEDKVDAQGTNGGCDVAFGTKDLPAVLKDFSEHFSGVSHWSYELRPLATREEYNGSWVSQMIFINGYKRTE